MHKRILLMLLAWMLAGACRAGGMEPCAYASVFENAALNAFVLPYRVEGQASTPQLALAGRQISALVHLEVLMSMLKYGSVGAKDLIAEGGQPCDVDQVLARVSRRPGAAGSLRPGQALLMVWGRLFEQGGELYLQSYLRFVRQGAAGPVPESLDVELGEGATRLVLTAGLPAQALAFAPRRISRAELAAVDREFRQAMVLRPQPRAESPGRAIEFSPHEAFSFWVGETRGDWMLIKPMAGGPSGWVKARSAAEEAERWSLQRWLPELAYVDAVAGFMRQRVGGLSAAEAARGLRAVELGLARYERAVPTDLAPVPWGLASALRGWTAWQQGRREEAAALFAQARLQLPDYAGARTLSAVAGLGSQPSNWSATAAQALAQQLVAALALAPQDAQALANLERLYALYARQPSWSPFQDTELAQRQAIVGAAAREAARLAP